MSVPVRHRAAAMDADGDCTLQFDADGSDGSHDAVDDDAGWMVLSSSGDAESVDGVLFFDAADGDGEAASDSDIMVQDSEAESSHIMADSDSEGEAGAKSAPPPTPPWGVYPCRPASSRGGVSVPDDVVNLDHTVERLLRKLGASRAALLSGASIRSACLCAGTGCTNGILGAVARGIKSVAGVGVAHVTVFYCEIQVFKQRFIRSHHGGDALIFNDVAALSSDAGDAVDSSGSRHRVPLDVHWVFCGPSCKDMSSLNGKRKHLGAVIDGRTGSSGTTFAGAVAFLEKSQAKLATLEMVLGLLTQHSHSVGDHETQNRFAWGNALRSAGFEFLFVTAASSDFFVPQARRRVYTVAASPQRCRLTDHEVRVRLERVIRRGVAGRPQADVATVALLAPPRAPGGAEGDAQAAKVHIIRGDAPASSRGRQRNAQVDR